jgi:hydroxyethylthiazole kinase-like sugar kinase family protein
MANDLERVQIFNIVAEDDKEGRLAHRSLIENYKTELQKAVGSERGEMDEINANGLTERLFDGVYARELVIQQGVTIVSELWNRERLWIIMTGKVQIISEMGKQVITAPYVGMAPFGSRIALYAIEETRWMAISNASDCETLADAEEKVKAKDYSDFVYPWDLIENKGDTP